MYLEMWRTRSRPRLVGEQPSADPLARKKGLTRSSVRPFSLLRIEYSPTAACRAVQSGHSLRID